MMEPMDPEMYADDVTFHAHTPATSGMGGSTRTFTGEGVAMRASVQKSTVTLTDGAGRMSTAVVHNVFTADDPGADVGDKFTYLDHDLTVQGHAEPLGIGGLSGYRTPCLETR